MENDTKPRLEPVPRDARPCGRARRRAARRDDEPPKNARRPFVILGVIVGVVLLAIGGYLLLTAGEESTDDAQVEADVVPVGTRVAGQVIKRARAGEPAREEGRR